MDNVRRFSDGNPGTICLADITPSDGNDWSAEAAAGWQRIADALELPTIAPFGTFSWHADTNLRHNESRAALRNLARDALWKVGRLSDADAETLRNFPCAEEVRQHSSADSIA